MILAVVLMVATLTPVAFAVGILAPDNWSNWPIQKRYSGNYDERTPNLSRQVVGISERKADTVPNMTL